MRPNSSPQVKGIVTAGPEDRLRAILAGIVILDPAEVDRDLPGALKHFLGAPRSASGSFAMMPTISVRRSISARHSCEPAPPSPTSPASTRRMPRYGTDSRPPLPCSLPMAALPHSRAAVATATELLEQTRGSRKSSDSCFGVRDSHSGPRPHWRYPSR